MMKYFLMAILLSGAFVGPAFAIAAAPAIAPRYTCEGGGLSRVGLSRGGGQQETAPCCTGQFGCPQLLSNTGLVRPKYPHRT